MITIEELSAYNRKLVDMNLKLRKKNKELKEKLKEKLKTIADKDLSFVAKFVALGIENAELKKQQFTLRNERNTFLAQNEQYEKDLIDFNEELTKAKELLKKIVYSGENEIKRLSKIVDILAEAEQFLSEAKND